MAQRSKFLATKKGSTFIIFALAMPVLIAAIGIAVDMARVYTVQNRAQLASDAALLGAVATKDITPDIQGEMTRIYNANYPTNYLGASQNDIQISAADPVYSSSFNVKVPYIMMNNFGIGDSVTLPIASQVTVGYTQERHLELTLVLDSTGSMAGNKLLALQQAAYDMIGIIFGSSDTLDTVHVSVVPYDVDVRFWNDHPTWVQSDAINQARHNNYVGQGSYVLANRNNDHPSNSFNDFTDDAPTQTNGEAARFREPPAYAWPGLFGWPDPDPLNLPDPVTGSPNTDFVCPPLYPMLFASNSQSEILGEISSLTACGDTRINVGLMWGWYTLSSKWQGVMDTSKPTLPEAPNDNLDKAMVLMTDGSNTVYLGANGDSDDNSTTAQLCENIKAQGITLYTIAYGTDITPTNQAMLTACASKPLDAFAAPDDATIRTVFHTITDDILYNTLRLSQ